MSVQLIVGSCGTGKTKYIYEKMISESMKENHAPIIYIVPEQANMVAEQDMISMHPMGGTMDISIMSFTRLAFSVFDKDNIYTGDVLDDYGKSMLIMKVLGECGDELSYYGKMVGKTGFVDEVKSVISELYQYGINVEKLTMLKENLSSDNSLYHKISDLIIIMSAFEKAMGNTFMVAEKMLSLFAQNIENSKMLRGAEIYFDGFTGFTPVQYDVIGQMMKNCGNMYFSITMDEDVYSDNGYSGGLFDMGKETVAHLMKTAADNNVTVLPHIALGTDYRHFENEELTFLENNLFRFPVKTYKETDVVASGSKLSAVNIVETEDVYDEIKCIGRMISNLVADGGYRYRDIAVITGDLDDNIDVWKQVMERMEIPYFTDCNELLMHNYIAEVVDSVIRLFEKDFSFDAVFSFLKTGFIDMKFEKICLLENYALKYGIKGFSWWNAPFKGNVKNLKKINDIRSEFISSIETLIPVFSKNSASSGEYIIALYEFVSAHNMGLKLWEQAKDFEMEGQNRQAMAYRQAYEKFLAVLDKTKDILGDEVVSRKIFGDILFAGISEMRLGIIPPTLDGVVIGDIERTRMSNIKILFVAGANEGVLPKSSKRGGIITDNDKKKLKEYDIALSPDSTEAYYIQQFYLYMQLLQSSERLYISYRKSDRKGGALNTSFFVKSIMKMFPEKKMMYSSMIKKNILPYTQKDLLAEFAYDMSDGVMDDSSKYKLLSEVDDRMKDTVLEGYMYMNQPGVLNDIIAKKLYGERMIHSVSRLENYASCEYRFFLQYGLKLKQPEEYSIGYNHIGTILHAVMEHFFKDVRDNKITFPIDDIKLNEKVKELAIEASNEVNDTIFNESFRMKHLMDVIIRIAQRSVNNLVKQLEKGDMKPEYFEKEFSPEDDISYIHMQLFDDVKMDIAGIIDRVDIKEEEDTVYVKVIDYKSGDKDIDYVKITEGKQLQLAVYMSVILEILQKKYPNKKIIPTGMYYYQLADKIVEGMSEEEIEANRAKESRMKGLVNTDGDCLEILDNKTGYSVMVSYNKNGELSSNNSHIVTGEELQAISRYTRDKMIEMGSKIIRGQIDLKPQKGENVSPCNYCDYRSVCRFEAGLGGNSYGIGSKLKKEEAKQLIMEQAGEV